MLLDSAASEALAAAKADFEENFTVLGFAGFVVDTARSAVENAADAFESATSGLAQTAEQIADLAFSIRNLKADRDWET